MKNISHISIVMISTILLISTDSICMDKQISCASNQREYQKQMDIIKEQLIIKEIERYGINHVERTLIKGIQNQQIRQHVDKDQNKLEPVFIIKRTFFKPKKKVDQLTKHIFDAICLRETKINSLDLQPKFLCDKIRYYFNAICLRETKINSQNLLPKFLCDEIRYYRIKNKPAVLIKASFTNAEEVQKIIAAHKSTTFNFLKNVTHLQIGTAFTAVACLLLLFNQLVQ